MEILNKPIGELKPYERNPRRNDEAVQYVAKSIKDFGFKVPMVIDSNNVIICGHTRYKAAKELGLEEVPCVIADDLTEEQIKAFRLADNKVSEHAKWDYELLNIELEGLQDFDMQDFGFYSDIDEDAFDHLFDMGEDEADEEEKEEAEEPAAESWTVSVTVDDKETADEIAAELEAMGWECEVSK